MGFAKAVLTPLVKPLACDIHVHTYAHFGLFPTDSGCFIKGASQKPLLEGLSREGLSVVFKVKFQILYLLQGSDSTSNTRLLNKEKEVWGYIVD